MIMTGNMEDWMLFNYIAGRASAEEKTEVEDWLAQDPLNARRMDQLSEIWEHSDSLGDLESVDLEGDWNNIRRRAGFGAADESGQESGPGSGREPGQGPERKTRRDFFDFNSYPLLKIAALIVLIAVPAVLLEMKFHIVGSPGVEWISEEAESGKKDLQLPDGTQITLNAHSRISWSEDFRGRKREVELSGEAWFNVTEDPGNPFIIRAGNDMMVEVIGTTFTVRSEGTDVLVRVISGKVALYREGNNKEGLVLEEGEMANGNAEGITKSAIEDPNFLSWKTGRLEFRNTMLGDVVKSLSDYSGRTISIRGESLEGMVLTSSYDNQELNEILEEIKLVLNIEYSIFNDSIVFHMADED
jgi:ferric-dicitrate binding protein FerR (iron transport regulator)